jgi:hypothetical protein
MRPRLPRWPAPTPRSAPSDQQVIVNRLVVLLIVPAAVILAPHRAEAQWYAAAYLGANHTHSASVTVDQPSLGREFTFHDVAFEGRPFEAPQYYGWRFGRWVDPRRRLGLELEFIHLKVIGRTDRTYTVSGLDAGEAAIAMNTAIQRYAMTHGLNFALINLVMQRPIGGRFSVAWRAGLGATIPHAETTIDGHARDQYEYGGPGGHLSAAIVMKTWRLLSTTAEYKFTIARPRIDVADGTGVTTSATHQVAVGFALDLIR